MARNYYFRFGNSDSATFTGLSPTFLRFVGPTGTIASPPGITEISSTGIYSSSYGATFNIAYVIDAFTTSVGASFRYIFGTMTPEDTAQERIGYSGDSIGSTSADPSTIYGLAKRLQEILEGQQVYTKSTGVLLLESRGATVLRSLTIADNTTQTTRT